MSKTTEPAVLSCDEAGRSISFNHQIFKVKSQKENEVHNDEICTSKSPTFTSLLGCMEVSIGLFSMLKLLQYLFLLLTIYHNFIMPLYGCIRMILICFPATQIKLFDVCLKACPRQLIPSNACTAATYVFVFYICDEIIINSVLIDSCICEHDVITNYYYHIHRVGIGLCIYNALYEVFKGIKPMECQTQNSCSHSPFITLIEKVLNHKKISAVRKRYVNLLNSNHTNNKRLDYWSQEWKGEIEEDTLLTNRIVSLKTNFTSKRFKEAKSINKSEIKSELSDAVEETLQMKRMSSNQDAVKLQPLQVSILDETDRNVLALKLSERMKNILFCSISHELRSPINHINGMLELIKQDADSNSSIMKFVEISISSCQMLKHKVDDILDYSQLETNSCKLKFEYFDIRELVMSIEETMKYQYDSKLITFRVYVADEIPDTVYHDPKRIKQILLNLIFNAFKFTEKGFVFVVLDGAMIQSQKPSSKLNVDDRNCVFSLNFAISDSGCGIEKRKRMMLFNMFSEAKVPETDDISASSKLMGIGLTFCQKMLIQMKSELKLATVLNVGSTFSFEIMAECKTQLISPQESRQISAPGVPINIDEPLHMNTPEFVIESGYLSLKMDKVAKEHSCVYPKSKLSTLFEESKLQDQRFISNKNLSNKFSNSIDFDKNKDSSNQLSVNDELDQLLGVDYLKVSEKDCDRLRRSKFGKQSFKYSNIINEVSQDREDSNEDLNSNSSISKESEDLYQVKSRIMKKMTNSDIPESLHDENTKGRKSVPIFHATVRKGWDTERKEPLKIEESKSYEHINQNNELEIYDSLSEGDKPMNTIKLPKAEESKKRAKSQSNSACNKVHSNPNNNQDYKNLESSNGSGSGNSSQLRSKSLIKHPEPHTQKELEKKPTIVEQNMIERIISTIKRDVPTSRAKSNFSRISNHRSSSYRRSSKESVFNTILRKCDCATILVVDDQIINRMILVEFGAKYSLRSDEAENGEIAFKMYKDSLRRTCCDGYKLILMDLNMPVMDGIRSTTKILNERLLLDTPKS